MTSTRYQYLFEWLQAFGTSSGVSIAVADGKLQVYFGEFAYTWTNAAPVTAGNWYHVVVTKQPGAADVYVNGQHTNASPLTTFGDQGSEVVIGASTWRGPGGYGEPYGGEIAQVDIWRGALYPSQVTDTFQSDAALYLGNGVLAVDLCVGALRAQGVTPNPSRHHLNVTFSLPTASPAKLELIDVTGRRVRAQDVGSLGAGTHHVDLGQDPPCPPASYLIRLTQGTNIRTAKAAVIR